MSFFNSQKHVTEFLLYNINVPINNEGKCNIQGVFDVLKGHPEEAEQLVNLIEIRNRYFSFEKELPQKKTISQNKI